jgi:hypothetical protein
MRALPRITLPERVLDALQSYQRALDERLDLERAKLEEADAARGGREARDRRAGAGCPYSSSGLTRRLLFGARSRGERACSLSAPPPARS